MRVLHKTLCKDSVPLFRLGYSDLLTVATYTAIKHTMIFFAAYLTHIHVKKSRIAICVIYYGFLCLEVLSGVLSVEDVFAARSILLAPRAANESR